MIDDVLNALSRSSSPSDQEMMFKIIEQAAHPLMHGGDRLKAKEVQDKFGTCLEYDGYCMDDWKVVKKTPELLKAVDERQSQRLNKTNRQSEVLQQTLNDEFNPSRVHGLSMIKVAIT